MIKVDKTVLVCDAIMGSGKTSAAINYMNEHSHQRFLFVTQFLSEADRISRACGFAQPRKNRRSKLTDILELLERGDNIASTHALFYRYTPEILAAIREGHYMLVLDEVVDVVKLLEISPSDVAVMFDANLIAVDPETRRVEWLRDEYDGKLNEWRDEINTSCVTYEDGHMMVWTLPIELFSAFDEVLVLTYMFSSQYQYYYYLSNKIDVKYIDVHFNKASGRYEFEDRILDRPVVHRIRGLSEKIHIISDEKLNAIGESYYALSSTWHKRITKEQADELRNNIHNLVRNIWNVSGGDVLWSVFKSSYEKIKRKGLVASYLTYNARATNDYGNRQHLAYCVNVFPNPDDMAYFRNRSFEIDADALALSDMVQWLWRSAIRNDKEVWLYLPSRRMRGLLCGWLREVSD